MRDPAPALTRGLHLLRLLGDAGPSTLEDLVRATVVPRSSLARLLDALAAAGLVARDDAKRWSALVALPAPTARIASAPAERLAVAGWCVETWALDAHGALCLGRREPRGWDLRLFAFPGWRPDRREFIAPVQLWWSACADAPPPRCWSWRGRQRRWIPAFVAKRTADAAGLSGVAADAYANHLGVRRVARLLRTADGTPQGALVIVVPPGGDADGARIALTK